MDTPIALVTGASKGIGKQIALTLAQAGFAILAHYRHDQDGAEQVVAAVRALAVPAIAVGGDLNTPAGLDRLADEIPRLAAQLVGATRLDVLVNNVGEAPARPFAELDDAYVASLFGTNVIGPLLLTQRLLRYMGSGARIINISSICARTYLSGLSVYGSTKGAVEALTRNLATELAPRGILVNAVAPGVIETEKSAWLGTEAGQVYAQRLQPLAGVGQPADVAAAVRFLASADARWVTGQVLTVSGGA